MWRSATSTERAVLGRDATVRAWLSGAGLTAAIAHERWQIGVRTASAVDKDQVVHALADAHDASLGVGPGLMRAVTGFHLPACSILVADGEQVAALSWGRPLGLAELGDWEYIVSTTPPVLATGSRTAQWRLLPPGMLLVLDPCGPTYFPLPLPPDLEQT